MSYFDNFLTANQAYVALHGDLRLPIKPKTQVAIVTCMDSHIHSQFFLEMLTETLVFKGLCATVCMVQDHNFTGSHLLLGNDQGADHVLCHAPSSIPQNVGISKSQT